MVTWSTKDHTQSIPRFLAQGHNLPSEIHVVSSWHVIGEGKGYLAVKGDPVMIEAARTAWEDVLDLKVEEVMTDDEARQQLPAIIGKK
jgi:hypothetical protein